MSKSNKQTNNLAKSVNAPVKKSKRVQYVKALDKFDGNLHKYKTMLLVDKNNLSNEVIEMLKSNYSNDLTLMNIKGSILRKMYNIKSDNQQINKLDCKNNFIVCLCNDSNLVKKISFEDFVMQDEIINRTVSVDLNLMTNRHVLNYIKDNSLSSKSNTITICAANSQATKKQAELLKKMKEKVITRKLGVMKEYETEKISKEGSQ